MSNASQKDKETEFWWSRGVCHYKQLARGIWYD